METFDKLDDEAKSVLGSVGSKENWNFFRFAHENSYGINTITKEGSKKGKVTIFARSVLTDHGTSGNYWDKGTTISLDKKTGKFTASFKSFPHTPPNTKFDVYVNGGKAGQLQCHQKRTLVVPGRTVHESAVDHLRCNSGGHLFLQVCSVWPFL